MSLSSVNWSNRKVTWSLRHYKTRRDVLQFGNIRRVQRRYRHPDAFGVSGLVLVFQNGELRRPGSGATLHVGRVLLEFDRRRTDIKGQDHTPPTAGGAILYND